MQTAAILLVGSTLTTVSGSEVDTASRSSEVLAGTPISCLEILGRSVLQRTIERLTEGGITTFTLLTEAGATQVSARPDSEKTKWPKQKIDVYSLNSPADIWPLVERTVRSLAANGIEKVFLMRLGAYVEFDPADVLQFLETVDQAGVRLRDQHGPLDAWLLNIPRLLQSQNILERLQSLPQASSIKTYPLSGYVNHFSAITDIRQFVSDVFHSRCDAKPAGIERRPGVWIDEGAILHRQARIVPPAYIGRYAKLGATTLITRSSNIERDCNIDYGTAVENSSVLAGTYIGAGLDLTHSVVYMNKLFHLQQNVLLEIDDEILVGNNQVSPLRRAFRRNKNAKSASVNRMEITALN